MFWQKKTEKGTHFFFNLFHNACVSGELQLKFRLGACPHLAKKTTRVVGE